MLGNRGGVFVVNVPDDYIQNTRLKTEEVESSCGQEVGNINAI